MDEIWQRVSRGRHTAVLGLSVGNPPKTLDLRLVHVSCDVPATTLGPLLEARRKVEQILDSEAPLLDQARGRVVAGLRRHLLGDFPAVVTDGSLVEAWNRLAHHVEPRFVLVFDAADAADEPTLDVLRQILGRPGWLRLPLLLVFRQSRPAGAAARLLEAVRAAGGDEAVIGAPDAAPPEPSPEPGAPAFELRALPPDVLRVLRTGAVVGSGFEAQLIAEVLGQDSLFVLECLQRASDAGLPIEDRGEGRFHLPDPLIDALRASLLPSLSLALHRRLAELLGGEPTTRRRPPAGSEPARDDLERPADEAPSPNAAEDSTDSPAPVSVEAPVRSAIGLDEVRRPAADAGGSPAAAAGVDGAPPLGAAPGEALPRPATNFAEALASGQILFEPPPADLPEAMEPEAVEPARPEPTAPVEEAGELFPRAAASAPEELADRDEVSREEPVSARSRLSTADDERGRPTTIDHDGRRMSTDGDDVSNVVPIWFKPFGGDRRSRTEPLGASFREAPPAAPPRREARPPRRRVDPPRRDEHRAEAPPKSDAARAAAHLAAAGEPEAGAERYFAAARQASSMGAYPQAVAHDRKALALLEGLPPSPRRRRLRVAILLDLGRLQWHAAGPDASFSLRSALQVLEAARASLHPDDPPELAAEVGALIAGVCHDIGDMRSLERALDELTSASRRLMSAGDALGAARLLNDQAAIYLRMGDPVRATHLLGESQKIFEDRAASDPVAMVEMAETDHLFATIPLHVAARPGRESDALTMGLDHALAAERVYKKLGAPRELGRVWETMGRIELRKDRLERAVERLSAAMQVQESIGDLLGLARSTAALSQVLLASGRPREALALLADSAGFNLEKGSPVGVAENRRAFEALVRKAPPDRETAQLAAQVDERLAAAESVLGRISLPGERDAARAGG